MSLPKKYCLDTIILKNDLLAEGIYLLEISCPVIAKTAVPGQFIQVGLNDSQTILRRPLSIAAADKDTGILSFIYRINGKGTKVLAEKSAGAEISCLGPLGQGFFLDAAQPLLVGGGMGIAPLLFLADGYNQQADMLCGVRSKKDGYWQNFLLDNIHNLYWTSNDGSLGEKGFVTDVLPKLLAAGHYDVIIACGPEIMMRAVSKIAAEFAVRCQVSLEKRMACGLGACLSCTLTANDGTRRKVCKDGPVFWAQEVF